MFTSEQVTAIVRKATGRLQMATILFAATGLRAGELLGLEVKHFDGSAIRVEQAVWGGNNKVGKPKTPNARRYVDLHPDVASLLRQFIGTRSKGFIFQTESGQPVTQTNILRREFHPLLDKLKFHRCGFHAFRRYRNTFLRRQQCPYGLLTYWLGWSREKDMPGHYDHSHEDVQYRRDVARSMGVGFELPQELTTKIRVPKIPDVNGRHAETVTTEVALAETR
jgi:integrase